VEPTLKSFVKACACMPSTVKHHNPFFQTPIQVNIQNWKAKSLAKKNIPAYLTVLA
jgi:hypothetical protein